MSATANTPGSIDRGRAFAECIVPTLKWTVGQEATPTDHVLWWSGFLGYVAGAAGADIGADAAEVIGQTLQKIVSSEANRRAALSAVPPTVKE